PSALFPSAEKMEQLYDALAEDIKNSSPEDYDVKPLGTVDINFSARFYSYMNNSERKTVSVPVYPSFEKTLALVNPDYLKEINTETVGTFQKTHYNYYDDSAYVKGQKLGYSEGYEKGKAAASEKLPYELPDLSDYQYSSDIYNVGYYDGFVQGYEEGFSVYGDPYTEGYNKGYEEGHKAGVNDAANDYDYTTPEYFYDGTLYSDGYNTGYMEGYDGGYYGISKD
ncbi:MAG: hypothetical protein J6V84_03000, partial [Clostridia bacterium]|nr:hypothetical protein [Clostridia bacterium]